MNLHELEEFTSLEKNNNGSILKSSKIIKQVLQNIKDILTHHGEYNDEIHCLSKEILTRAFMLDMIFNPLKEKIPDGWLIEDDSLDFTHFNFQNQNDEEVENEIYYHTPSIGVFFNGVPIFLNHNYIQALGAKNEAELKKDIIEGIALEKYYEKGYDLVAKEAVSKLSEGEGYKDLILKTKQGKILSWNSFGNTKGLEIRIGSDITQGVFNKINPNTENFEGMNLDTKTLLAKYATKVHSIIGLTPDFKSQLIIFGILSTILDKIWNDGQFLMNITINEENSQPMSFNSNYASALHMKKEDIIDKIQRGVLWSEVYDEDTLTLIEGLMKCLKDDGYYLSEFGIRIPKTDTNGKQIRSQNGKIQYKKLNFSWLRFLIEDKDFDINRTFGIGTNVISKDNAELAKFLQGF